MVKKYFAIIFSSVFITFFTIAIIMRFASLPYVSFSGIIGYFNDHTFFNLKDAVAFITSLKIPTIVQEVEHETNFFTVIIDAINTIINYISMFFQLIVFVFTFVFYLFNLLLVLFQFLGAIINGKLAPYYDPSIQIWDVMTSDYSGFISYPFP